MTTLSDFTATTLTGEEQPLSAYDGKVALVVNTASECGFTPQYQGLQELHVTYADEEEVEVRATLAFSVWIANHFVAADHGARTRSQVLGLAMRRLLE